LFNLSLASASRKQTTLARSMIAVMIRGDTKASRARLSL
jgi:hypothetical protein